MVHHWKVEVASPQLQVFRKDNDKKSHVHHVVFDLTDFQLSLDLLQLRGD
jgi:hypothetical protein